MSLKEKTKELWAKVKAYFLEDTGSGKSSLNVKRAGIAGGGLVLLLAGLGAVLSPSEDLTFYNQNSSSKDDIEDTEAVSENQVSEVNGLFVGGSKALAEQRRLEAARKRGAVTIKYFAPQIIGAPTKGPKAIKMGAKLLGFLLTSIDTREPSLVSVLLPRGGVSDSGMEIPKDSILIGNFGYSGEGSKVALQFARLDTPDGDSIKISAVGLDAADYTAGVRGKVFSDNTVKLVSSFGLTMAASMTDVLTEREALSAFGYAEAKPTMKNALLQGVSNAAKEQAGRMSEEISSKQDYVVIPKGKEVIVQLTEDFTQ